MTNAFRWLRLFVITVLLVATAGVAAAPMRQSLLPLIGRPFGIWNNAPLAAVHAPFVVDVQLAATTARLDSGTPLITAPDRLAFVAAPTGQATLAERAEYILANSSSSAGSDSWSENDRSNSRGGRWRGAAGGSGGSGGFGGSTYTKGQNGGGFVANSRSDADTAGPRQGSAAPSSSASSGGGRGPSNSGGGGGGHADTPAASKPGEIFKEHRSGMGKLTGNNGRHGEPGTGGVRGGGTVAVNPEPSTLLLFGTGIAAVAGAVRRRLRR
jgi:hypothetical protein